MRRYLLAGLVLAASLGGVGLLHRPDPPPAAAAAPVIKAPNTADIAFAQMMVAHHEQAVRMSKALIAEPGDAGERVLRIAEFVAHDQQREIDETKAWLSAWGVDGTHEHGDGHGMLTEAQLARLDEAPAETLFLTLMIEHHQGAIAMARSLLDGGGQNVYTHSLAKHVINEQTDENTAMAKLLAERP